MKVLFIGGTGNISRSASELAINKGIDLYLLNRGNRSSIKGANVISGNISNYTEMKTILEKHSWDVVVNWIAFVPDDVERDYNLFSGKTKQYIFISSASTYQKPVLHPIITESTPLYNPYWDYSQNKIACEEKLIFYYRQNHFPITIVRPSLTYDTVIPVPIGGWLEYTIIDRMKKGKKIIVHGDGTSLWIVTHAEDFAKGFFGLLGNQHSIGHAFHITTDEILTWDQIHKSIADAAGVEANIVHIPSDYLSTFDEGLKGSLIGDKAHSVIFDNSKIKTFVPEFKATILFSEGIKRTLNWFETDPKRMIIKEETNNFIDRVINSFSQKSD